MLQRRSPHLKLGVFGSKTIGASDAAAAEALDAAGAGGSAFEHAPQTTRMAILVGVISFVMAHDAWARGIAKAPGLTDACRSLL
jgi:hypothetical protein